MDEVVKHLNELTRCGLVREVDGLYRPTFAIFTLKDQRILQPLIDDLVSDIVKVVKDNKERLQETIDNLSIVKKGLRFADLEYIVLGAITLDYEGLEVFSEEDMLIKSKKMPGGGGYVFAGFEVGLIDLRESWMWGHNGVFGKYWFSSHGKLPPRGRRVAFPDLAWLWYEGGVSLNDIESKTIEIGRILEALLHEDLTLKDLHKELDIDEPSLAVDLTMLLILGYVTVLNGKIWRLNIPVFTPEDYENIKSLSRLILRTVANNFKSKKDVITKYYNKTPPARNGIPLKEAFNQIYHLVFEKALNKLIESNIIKGPSLRPDGGRYSVFTIILEENMPKE